MTASQMASEVAAFYRDVGAALQELRHFGGGRGGSRRWASGQLRYAHGANANWDTPPCECSTGNNLGTGRPGLLFLEAMVAAVPGLYSSDVVDWYSSHSYPFSSAPWGADKATRGLAYYRNETLLIGRPDLPVAITETGWRRNLQATPPTTAADQANWTALALSKVWLDDAQVVAVCPFLLAGSFWEKGGWPWMETAGVTLKPLAVFTAIRELRCSRAAGGCL